MGDSTGGRANEMGEGRPVGGVGWRGMAARREGKRPSGLRRETSGLRQRRQPWSCSPGLCSAPKLAAALHSKRQPPQLRQLAVAALPPAHPGRQLPSAACKQHRSFAALCAAGRSGLLDAAAAATVWHAALRAGGTRRRVGLHAEGRGGGLFGPRSGRCKVSRVEESKAGLQARPSASAALRCTQPGGSAPGSRRRLCTAPKCAQPPTHRATTTTAPSRAGEGLGVASAALGRLQAGVAGSSQRRRSLGRMGPAGVVRGALAGRAMGGTRCHSLR